MKKNEITSLLAEVLETDTESIDKLPMSSPLSDLGLNSLKFIEFVVTFEEKYDVEVYDSDLVFDNFATIGAVYKTLEKYFDVEKKLYKCIVTDCDGVLWKGIVGEDSEDSEDRAYIDSDTVEFQKALKAFAGKGIYICVCTKNSYDNISAMLENNVSLELSDITISKTDIHDKSAAIKEIAEELGISNDSVIFIDDNDYELGLVCALVPDITVIKADYDENTFVPYLNSLFKNISEQSLDRTKLYREQKEREKIHITASSADEYNEQLQTRVDCGFASHADAERIAELSQRTNRFNMSGKRYTKEDIENLMNNGNYKAFILKVSDVYGDMGLVAAAIVAGDTIENFMLSCRVFGCGFEKILIEYIKSNTKLPLTGVYTETEKNKSFQNFYEDNGIKKYEL